MSTERSKKWRLNFRDLIKGTVTAAFTAVTTAAYTGIDAGAVDVKTTITTAILAAIGYLLKNLTENENGETTTKAE